MQRARHLDSLSGAARSAQDGPAPEEGLGVEPPAVSSVGPGARCPPLPVSLVCPRATPTRSRQSTPRIVLAAMGQTSCPKEWSCCLEGGRSLSQRRHALTTQLVKPGEATAQGQDQPLDGAGDLSAIAR